jgi:hypothetical protein
MSEFTWGEIDPTPLPGGKMCRIVDMKGVGMTDLGPEALNFVKVTGTLHIRTPYVHMSPRMGGVEYPSPYATAGRKRRPKGAMVKVPGVCLIRRR